MKCLEFMANITFAMRHSFVFTSFSFVRCPPLDCYCLTIVFRYDLTILGAANRSNNGRYALFSYFSSDRPYVQVFSELWRLMVLAYLIVLFVPKIARTQVAAL